MITFTSLFYVFWSEYSGLFWWFDDIIIHVRVIISHWNLILCLVGVQILGNFASGYPELFFERVLGTRIFVMFPKLTSKRASRHPGSGTRWHTSMNSLDLLCSTFEQCRINFRKSQILEILPFMKSNVYFALSNSIRILICVDYTIFVDGEIDKILLHAKIFRKDLYFRRGTPGMID